MDHTEDDEQLVGWEKGAERAERFAEVGKREVTSAR